MVELLPAKTHHLPALAELHVATWRAAYRDLLPADLLSGLSVDERAVAWEQRLRDGVDVVVACEGDAVLGFVSCGASRDDDAGADVAEVYGLYVAADRWGTGLGARLLEAATDRLQGWATGATLWVLRDNTRARAFYDRQGWRDDGVTRTIRLAGASLPEVRCRRTWATTSSARPSG